MKYASLVKLVEEKAAVLGIQMNPMRARQEAGRLYHRIKRYVHISVQIAEVPSLNADGTPSGVVHRYAMKPGHTYRKP